ncbi:MAG: OmpP1/FadL family transporter [Verrucomicrobiia bacterium]
MKYAKSLVMLGSAFGCVALLPQSTLAGGLSLYEISTPDVGLASAGYAAGALDATTLFKNPAGMSLLDGPQANASLQALYGSVKFAHNSQTSTTGSDGGNAIGVLPGLSMFITYPVTEKLSVGFGAFSYFGLSEDFGNNWVGRYYAQNATLLGMSLMPAASYKVNDWLSVGGGLNAMYGYLNAQTAINTLGPNDGQLTLKDEVWGFGGNAGIMIMPREGTRIGINYLSQVKLNFSDKPQLDGAPGLGLLPVFHNAVNMGMTVPQSVMVGIYQKLNAQWAVMADVGWQQWSKFGEVEIGYDGIKNPNSLTTQLNFNDTWHGALGLEYKYSDQWRFTGGFAYDSSAVSDANRPVILPIGAAYRFGLGSFYTISKSVDLGAAYELAWSGDLPVTQTSSPYRGNVVGSYNNAYFMFFSLNLNWRF